MVQQPIADLILGVDGGGSKTRALLADRAGRVLGAGSAPSSNYQAVGFAAATAAILAAAQQAAQQAGYAGMPRVAAACLGLAGVDRPADAARFDAWVREQGLAARWAIVNDAELVLAGGTPAGWGVALICGTGSIAYGRAPDGRVARAGGWGYLLGDEGSGYDLALRALRLATQTADGRADAQALLQAILATWQLGDASELIGYVYHPEMTRAAIAGLARVVLELAEAGDAHAAALVRSAAEELARLVEAVMRRLDLHAPPLALGGGLLTASPRLRAALDAAIGVPLGPQQIVSDPAQGALCIAQRSLDLHR